MQVTGDRFTDESALFGNDLSTLPNYPAEIRAPAGTLAGVSAFQIHISDHEILTPGDAPNVLVAMNPAALKANVEDLPTGGTLVVNVDSFEERALAKAGYETDPLEGRQPVGLPGLRDPDDLAHARGVQADRGQAARCGAEQELLRARAAVVALPSADSRDRALDRPALRAFAGRRRGEHARVPGRLQLRRDRRDLRVLLRDRAGRAPAGHVHQRHRQHRARLGAARSLPARRSSPSSWAPTRSRRHRTSCTSCRSTRTSASGPSRPRTRSPASARHSAPPSAAPSA